MHVPRLYHEKFLALFGIVVIFVSILAVTVTIKPVMGLNQLLVDSEFNDSADNTDLRNNATGQDWYESRNDNPTLLTLDTNNVGGNSGNKAKLSENTTSSAYLTQEFSSPQTVFFMAQWDIYVESIVDISQPDRAGWMLIGDDSNPTRPGPNSDDNERFVYLGFYKPGGGTTGTMDLVARDNDDAWASFTTVATGLNLKQWYTIKVLCNLTSDTYDVYVNEVFKATVTARNGKTSVTHISFAQWNDGAGTFYVDNVSAATLPTVPTVSIDPADSTVKVGEQFAVNISLDYAQKLYGYEVWLSFDKNKLNATAIEYVNYLNPPTNLWSQQVNNTGGYAMLAISSIYPATAKTGGSPPPLATVRFTCIGVGTSLLHLYKTILSDDQARPIAHLTSDGQVNCTPSVIYDDVVFDSSFEMGNLINVTFQEGNASGYRYYTAELNYSTATFPDKHWWFYFSMENVTGKTVKVELKNLAEPDFTGLPSPGIPRWPDIEPVYSYNNVDWLRITDGNYSCGNNNTRNFNITLSPTQNKVWVAPIPPYTVTMRDNLFNSYSSSPYLSVASLGITPLGQNLKIATITDQHYSDDGKFKIYIIAQQHSGETIASFVTEGMIRFLLNATDETAAAIRRNYVFKIVPIMNVEGVYYGISRYTPFRQGSQCDLNRAWDDNPISTTAYPEVNWTFTDIQNWMPDAFLDMHSEVNGESGSQTSIDCFFLHDGLYDASMTNFCNNVSRGRDGTKDYWPETGARSATGSQMAAVNVRTRLGVHPATDMEHPHDDLKNTTAHPVDHNPQTIADWKDWGRRIVLGIFDYFGERLNTPPVAGNLTVTPLLPLTTDNLVGSYDYYDAEADPENGTEIRWYKGDILQPELNDTLTVPYTVTTKGETWYFTVRPKDGKDFGTMQFSPSVAIQNSPPTIDSFTPIEATPEVNEGDSLEFSQTSSDPDNDTLTYSWLLDSVEQATTQNWTYSPDFSAAGTHNITVAVSDGELFDSQEWDVTVINVNRPPSIDSYNPPTDPTITEGKSQEFNITCSDPDEDPITVQWYLNGTPTVTTNSYIFIAYYGSAGSYNVTVIISDGFAQTSHEWTLTVRPRVKIVEVTPCNAIGNPKDTFARGTLAYFKVVVNNTGSEPVNILITVNIYDSDGVTIGVASFQGPISPGVTTLILGLPIPTTANLGEATVYASAFTDWIHNGGVPYCAEVSATFEIE